MQKLKRKALVVAWGRYRLGNYETKIYQITRTSVRELAWHSIGSPPPPEHWSLPQARHHCLADLRELAKKYGADQIDIRQEPDLRVLRGMLEKRGFKRMERDEVLLVESITALGGVRAAAAWLTHPAPECRGEIPLAHAAKSTGWWRVLHVLLRKEYLPKRVTITT